MTMLITGGSGALGSRIARQATEAGMDVRVMSRRGPRMFDGTGCKRISRPAIIGAAVAGPSNGTVNFGGPEVLRLDHMAARWLAARQVRKRLIRIPVRGAIARAFVAAKNTTPEGERARYGGRIGG